MSVASDSIKSKNPILIVHIRYTTGMIEFIESDPTDIFLDEIKNYIHSDMSPSQSHSRQHENTLDAELYEAVGPQSDADIEQVQHLLQAGADPEITHGDETCLMRACIYKPWLVPLLLEYGADINRVKGLNTALKVTLVCSPLMVPVLISGGAVVTSDDVDYAVKHAPEVSDVIKKEFLRGMTL
eukprot:TRINITY_DN2538_c0_g1_i2.p1 TRINITY_DN2538_c0_g1~~TRINITY_DN2538_c0_g1_i2.p1  ORF type:complete len:184 (-),score=12.99 TRINITY_DN2538_c0_g1_i2:46-597(-)